MSENENDILAASKYVLSLTPEDFEEVATWKLKSKDCTAVIFYTNWCGYCKEVKPEWIKFGQKAKYIDVAAMDCELHKSHVAKIKEDMPQLIQGYPSIAFYSDGKPIENFPSDKQRNLANFLKTSMDFCNPIK